MSRFKKIILIALLLILALFIGYAIYKMVTGPSIISPIYQPTSPTGTAGGLTPAGPRGTTGTVGTETGVGTLPTAGTLPTPGSAFFTPTPVTQLTTDYTAYPSINSNNAIRYYNSSNGKFYIINPDGTVTELSDQTFYNVNKITWAKTANKAVLEYADSSKVIYNFDSAKQVTLPKHWEDFSFSPDSTQLAAKSIGVSPDNRWLAVINDDGTGARAIEDLGANQDKVNIDWSPSRQVVAFSRTGEALGGDRQQILMIGLNRENFKGLTVEGRGFESTWSPDGKKLLYSVWNGASNFEPELWVVNSYGDDINSNRKMVKVNTWSNKCAFADNNTIFCAVPRSLPEGAGLEPSINTSPDDLYKIDLNTGTKIPISMGDKDYTVDSMFYDKEKNRLMFTDKFSTGVFETNLNQ